jgi:hypothetical protein
MMISKRTNTILIEEMSSKDLTQIAQKTQEQSALKWNARKNYSIIHQSNSSKTTNKLRAVPNSWCKLVNTMVNLVLDVISLE